MLAPGTRVSYLTYGVSHTGTVTKHDTSIVFIMEDDTKRMRWMHETSVEVVDTTEELTCLRCAHSWEADIEPGWEAICPACGESDYVPRSIKAVV